MTPSLANSRKERVTFTGEGRLALQGKCWGRCSLRRAVSALRACPGWQLLARCQRSRIQQGWSEVLQAFVGLQCGYGTTFFSYLPDLWITVKFSTEDLNNQPKKSTVFAWTWITGTAVKEKQSYSLTPCRQRGIYSPEALPFSLRWPPARSKVQMGFHFIPLTALYMFEQMGTIF